MSHPLWDIVRIDVPCPTCKKKDSQTVADLVLNLKVTCGFCREPIDISSESWRASIQELAQALSQIGKFPPVGD